MPKTKLTALDRRRRAQDARHRRRREKVRAIVAKAFGPKGVSRLDGMPVASFVNAVARAHPRLGTERALDLAFHLTDWREDGAFLLALSLAPERFTKTEVTEGITAFLVHAPNHVAAAAVLGDWPIEDIFRLGVKVTPRRPARRAR